MWLSHLVGRRYVVTRSLLQNLAYVFFLAVVQSPCGGQWTGGFGPGVLEECSLERLHKKGSLVR